MAARHANKILLLGSLPVDESKTHPYQGQPEIESSNRDIERYEQAMRSVAEVRRVDFVPLFELGQKHSLDELLISDGVHPGAHGHQLIADAVWPTVESWI